VEIWELVYDQLFSVDGKHVRVNLAAVAPVVTMYGLAGDEALWMLKKIKLIGEILGRPRGS
jgi:hypothetical protein